MRLVVRPFLVALIVGSVVALAGVNVSAAYAYPSWQDVQNAKGNEAAKKSQIASLQGFINQIQAELDVAVKANSPLLKQIDTKQSEINTLQDPIVLAQLYAVEQIALKYDAAQQAVITAKKINVILTPDSFVWAPEAIDVTPAITAELDKAVPSVTITPPSGWRPSRQIGALYQQIQQLISAATQQAQAAAAAQARSAAPAAQPESR